MWDWKKKKQPKNNRILVLVDLENLLRNSRRPPAEGFSPGVGFERLLEKLQPIGEIAGVFVFAPPHLLVPTYTRFFQQKGFCIIFCPKMESDEKKEAPGPKRKGPPGLRKPIVETHVGDKPGYLNLQDTVDGNLIALGDFLTSKKHGLKEITHVCLCSGDEDYLSFLERVAKRGLKIIIVAGDMTSLSANLIRMAERDPATRQRRVWFFSQVNT